MKKVSVIIPVYNRKEMLDRAVKSVLSQTYKNFELIIVNDASNESLEELKNEFTADKRVIWIDHQENLGVAEARNSALKLVSGEYVALLDSDDEWLHNKLEVHLNYHNENPKFKFSQTLEDWYRNDKKVNKMKKHFQPLGDAFAKSLNLCCISSSSVILEKKLYDEIGHYDTKLSVCEDYDFWIRLTNKYEIGLVSEILVNKFGGHEDQLSKAKVAMDRFRLYSLLKLFITNNLEDKNRTLLIEEIKNKSNILSIGAKKRENNAYLLYEDIFKCFDNLSFNNINKFLEEIDLT